MVSWSVQELSHNSVFLKTRLQTDSLKIRERKAPFKRRLLHARDEKAYFPADAAVCVAPWRGRPVNALQCWFTLGSPAAEKVKKVKKEKQ